MSAIQIRRLTESDWERYREIRMRALRQAPDAFSTTLAEARRWGESDWRARLFGRVAFVADHDGHLVGLVSGMAQRASATADSDRAAELISMWVQPEWRGRGVGDRLVEAVAAWGSAEGFLRLRLWVADGNLPAKRLYRRHGFRPTGERQPLGAQGRTEVAMECSLEPGMPTPTG